MSISSPKTHCCCCCCLCWCCYSCFYCHYLLNTWIKAATATTTTTTTTTIMSIIQTMPVTTTTTLLVCKNKRQKLHNLATIYQQQSQSINWEGIINFQCESKNNAEKRAKKKMEILLATRWHVWADRCPSYAATVK